MRRNYLTELDLSPDETMRVLDEARRLKSDRSRGVQLNSLAGKAVALYFEKPSVRTRVSFTLAARELGAEVVELGSHNTKVGHGEDLEDFAMVLNGYVHALVARVFGQSTLDTLAKRATMPVINALSDERHPCQALADVMTILERFGRIDDRVITFVGEGNNVATSLALLAASLGAEVRVASPVGYALPAWALAQAEGLAGKVVPCVDPRQAAEGAHVLVTDTWVSMGREGDAAALRAAFVDYRLGEALIARARPEAIVMHCLPAVRGEEITEAVMYGPRSAIWQEAENRLHVQKALLARLMGRHGG